MAAALIGTMWTTATLPAGLYHCFNAKNATVIILFRSVTLELCFLNNQGNNAVICDAVRRWNSPKGCVSQHQQQLSIAPFTSSSMLEELQLTLFLPACCQYTINITIILTFGIQPEKTEVSSIISTQVETCYSAAAPVEELCQDGQQLAIIIVSL